MKNQSRSRCFLGKEAFTLIEMLIVIAIIGILSAVILISVQGARSKAAVARSVADMTNMRNSIEAAAAEGCTAYTVNSSGVACTAPTAKTYARLNAAPSGVTYTISFTSASNYTMTAKLQGSGNGTSTGTDTYVCDTGGCKCTTASNDSSTCTNLP